MTDIGCSLGLGMSEGEDGEGEVGEDEGVR